MAGRSSRFAYHAAAVPFRRRLVSYLALALIAAGAACTKDEPQVPTSSAAVSGGPVTSNEAVTFVPGRYRYTFHGIDASLNMEGSRAALDIRNTSGAELAAPVIYVIGQDGTRYDATIEGAGSIADGASASLTVTFPDAVKPDTVGLMVLSFGADNVGAFAPVAAGASSPSG